MDAARETVPEGGERLASHAPPRVRIPSFTREELRAAFRGGERQADECEALLACAARIRGGIDLALAEGLHALRQGDRLARLGCHLDDYAREVLDLGERAARNLARLGRELPSRPLLREALRSGRVRLRAAETVLPVAIGDAEAEWVRRAERLTVRELESEVRRVRAGVDGSDEPWLRLRAALRPEERVVVDEALELAGELHPGSTRAERLEALAQELLAEIPGDADEDDARGLDGAFRPLGPGDAPRRAALEADTERWAALPRLLRWRAPDARFDEHATAEELDARLRELARVRAGWDDVIGPCARIVRDSGLHTLLGFASFRHYVEERLGLGASTVEQRVALERRLAASPALEAARRRGVGYEKLRLLARLPEHELARWAARALVLTCVALRRALGAEEDRQLRAAGALAAALPRGTAVLLNAAFAAVRARADRVLPAGKCLVLLAWHFCETHRALKRAWTRSRKVRDRDEGFCQVPGCSHRATHAHHITFRSHGGGDELANQVALCAFHHLRCVHGGYLKVAGRAPDELRWFLGGAPWSGPRA